MSGCIRAVERGCEAHKDEFGRPLPVNVDGAIAAICADLGFAYELGNAVFLVSRLPGLIAHAHEERLASEPMRQIDPKDHDYDGARERRLPETGGRVAARRGPDSMYRLRALSSVG